MRLVIDGEEARGIDPAKATEVFELMAKFAGYGFNKCHAVPYGLLAYQTAWLKANHPEVFIAACMSLALNNTDRLAATSDGAHILGASASTGLLSDIAVNLAPTLVSSTNPNGTQAPPNAASETPGAIVCPAKVRARRDPSRRTSRRSSGRARTSARRARMGSSTAFTAFASLLFTSTSPTVPAR